jgi:hypothetical protein
MMWDTKFRSHCDALHSPMTHAPVQPGVTATFTVKGYTVHVTADGNGLHHVTSPDLPQLSVSDGSLNGALALAENAIAAIVAGRHHKPEGTA